MGLYNDAIFSDGDLSVIIPDEISRLLEKHCFESYPKECGGILIGYYSESLTEIHVTSLTWQKSRMRAFFQRSNKGIKELLDEEWKHGRYYIGEWHYHPDSSPSPSKTDIDSMICLAGYCELHCPEPILLIVGGRWKNWNYDVSIFLGEKQIRLHQR